MNIKMELGNSSYDIVVERGALNSVGSLLDLDRKVLIITDKNVPAQYAKAVLDASKEGHIVTLDDGEKTKGFPSLTLLLQTMVEKSFTRFDCVVSVGGGVIGDLGGFCASCYMRGVDFYNIPTTLLSQIDSSIGGKTAINFAGVKNIIGAFYQPKKVIIDPDVLATLDKRQLSNGLAEAVKMAMTSDRELFELIENSSVDDVIDEIIIKSLLIKKAVVEEDEKETGLRKVLNFGHTIGHGIEAVSSGKYYHGECVALGMIAMTNEKLRGRLIAVLEKLNLPTTTTLPIDEVFEVMLHDKKFTGNEARVVVVEEIGEFKFKKLSFDEMKNITVNAF